MACNNCTNPNDLPVFTKVETDDSEYYIEDNRSAWSIITPVSGNDVTNLFKNGSMEEAFDPDPDFGEWWPVNTGGATIGGHRVTDTAYAGVYSLQFWDFVQYQTAWLSSGGNLFPRTPGITYCVSMMVKTCCDHKVKAGIYNSTDGWLAYGEVTGTGCWQQLSFCIAADIGPSLVSDIITSYLRLESDLQCTENYVDQITVTATPQAHFDASGATDTSYCECYTPFDGDSVNAHWTGDAHTSTSVMSAYSRTIGAKTPLSDFGFRVIAYSGAGLPPVVTSSTQYARRSGASVQRARANSRTITITGELCGCSWKELATKKETLINALGLNLSGDCSSSREIYLSYECVDDCGDVSGRDLRIRVNYNGGLEGSRSRPFCERITLSFIANSDPTFQEDKQYCKQLTPGGSVTVNNCGNDYASVRLIGYNNGSMTLTSLENVSTGKIVNFGTGGTGYTSTGPNQLIFTNAPGLTSFKEVGGATSTNLNSQMNISDNSKPTQFLLAPGKNTIKLTGSVSGLNSRFVICWRNKFLSSDSSCGDCECEQE